MASDYQRGEMDIHEQTATYVAVMQMTKWGSLATAVSLFVLTLWFCTDTGFLGGLVSGVVMLALGVVLLRDKKTAAGH